MKAKFSKFKLYLEGKEVNFSEISLVENAYSLSQCSVMMAANSNIANLLPGTIAQLFYYDSNDKEYYIIFEGEFVALNFSKTASQQMVTLQFVSINSALQRTFRTPTAYLFATGVNTLEKFLLIDASNKNKNIVLNGQDLKQATNGFLNNLIAWNSFFQKLKDGLDGNNEKLVENAMFELFKEAELTNEWYSYFAKSFKISDRLLVFPNTKALVAIENQVRDIFNYKKLPAMDNATPYLQLIYSLLSYIGYVMIQAPAPCYGSSQTKSYVFGPDFDYLTPIRSNIIFGDSVQNAGFTKNVTKENTRLSVTGGTLSNLSSVFLKPTYFLPTLENLDKNTGKVDFSEKEQYIGIVPGFSQMNDMERAFSRVSNKPSNTEGPVEKITQAEITDTRVNVADNTESVILGAGVNDYIINIANKTYWDNIYKTRSFSVSCPYSPYRMAGFAGIFIDKNLPTVAGIIKSINTKISSNGSAQSTINFLSPRIIWEFSEDGIGLQTADVSPELPIWYDKGTFSLKNIGKKVYNKILGENSTTSDLSSIFKWEELDEWKKISNLIGSRDSSINKKIVDIYKNPDHPLYNSLSLSIVVKAIKEKYYSLSDDVKVNFEISTNRRKLLSENNYWNFIFSGKTKLDNDLEGPAAYNKDDIYRDITSEKISINTTSYKNYKPFILQRLQVVEKIK